MESCNQGLGIGTFDFSKYEEVVKVNPEDSVSFIAHWKRRRLELKMEPILYTTRLISRLIKLLRLSMSELKISTVLALPLFN
jgi:hypothetical protein